MYIFFFSIKISFFYFQDFFIFLSENIIYLFSICDIENFYHNIYYDFLNNSTNKNNLSYYYYVIYIILLDVFIIFLTYKLIKFYLFNFINLKLFIQNLHYFIEFVKVSKGLLLLELKTKFTVNIQIKPKFNIIKPNTNLWHISLLIKRISRVYIISHILLIIKTIYRLLLILLMKLIYFFVLFIRYTTLTINRKKTKINNSKFIYFINLYKIFSMKPISKLYRDKKKFGNNDQFDNISDKLIFN
jgi:hypothetical protein